MLKPSHASSAELVQELKRHIKELLAPYKYPHTRRQIELIAERAVNSPRIKKLYLADCGHSQHRDQPERTLEAITRFIESLER